MMHIREATLADRAATVALWVECGLTRPWNDPDLDFDRSVSGPTSAVLVACDDDGNLHGSVMVGAAEAWLRHMGMPKVELMVRADNAGAHQFYDALDYEPSDVVVRQKWLTEP